MLELAGTGSGDVVYDLGSGDGRIVILAAEKFGARGVGIELNPELVTTSRQKVAAKGLQEKVTIVQANFLDVDLSPATVVTLYLTDAALATLRPHLERQLRPGTRVVVRFFQIPGWTFERMETTDGSPSYLYTIK